MPLILKPKPMPRPNIEMEFVFGSAHLTEMDGTAYYQGNAYHVIIGRKGVDSEHYGMLEIQQVDHSADQVEEVELYGDGYTYSCIPLPPSLRSLDGDVVTIGQGVTAALAAGMVQPWVYPDADGNYPPNKPYSMLALVAQLTTEQTDTLFATLGVDSWEDVLEEQRNR